MKRHYPGERLLIFITMLATFALSACGSAVVEPIPETATTIPTEALPTPTLAAATLPPSPTPVPRSLIVLDPGHGGDDWGTFHTNEQGKPDLFEKDITLQLALETSKQLATKGYRVLLTRTTDASANSAGADLNSDGEVDQFDDLQARLNLANQSKANLLLSIHINGSEQGNEVYGLESWYCADRPFAAQSKTFATLIQKESIEALAANDYQAEDRKVEDDVNIGAEGDHFFLFGPVNQTRKSATEMPGVLTEALFITNDTEAALLTDPEIIKSLATGYTTAIDKYFNP